MVKPKTNAMSRRMPTGHGIGFRARFAAMVGVLRCLVAPPRAAFSTSHFVLNANGYHRPRKTRRIRQRSLFVMRLVHRVVVVLRLIVAMTAVQITGIPHVAADMIVAMQSDDHEDHSHENCPNDDDGRQCPPGCPSCHCTHAMSALPVAAPPTVLDRLIPMEMAIAPYKAQGPPNPDPITLYRPPRMIRASS